MSLFSNMVHTDRSNVNTATESTSNSRRAVERYHCSLCPRSYKRAAGLDDHVRTFHERARAWSCAAFTNHDMAFQWPATESSSQSGERIIITCIFCEEMFSDLATSEVRENHLRYEHRFWKCNPDREFFRFAHVQQHLKHYHSVRLPNTPRWRDAFLLRQTSHSAQAAASSAEGSLRRDPQA